MSKPNVCIIGAGVSGLSTAYYLLSKTAIPLSVTVIAEKFTPHTTSDVAFGLWEPYLVGGTPLHKIKKWGGETLARMVKLAYSKDGAKAGTFVLSGHSIFREKAEEPSWKDEAVNFRHLTRKELTSLYPGFKYGWSWTTAASECRYYLPYLMDKIRALGGTFVSRRISSLQEISGDYDVIVNCSGLESKHLAGDHEVKPIKGQVIRVKAPWLKHFIFADEMDTYIIPGRESVVLGGSHDEENWNLEINKETVSRIHRNCCKILPSLQDAEVLKNYVGLRPGRSEVRVEAEIMKLERNGQTHEQKVVHNYGHGGAGIGLHWGCAKEAAELVVQSLIPKQRL